MVVVASFWFVVVEIAITDSKHPLCICCSAVVGHVCERGHGGWFGTLCAHKTPGRDKQVSMHELVPRVSLTETLNILSNELVCLLKGMVLACNASLCLGPIKKVNLIWIVKKWVFLKRLRQRVKEPLPL